MAVIVAERLSQKLAERLKDAPKTVVIARRHDEAMTTGEPVGSSF
jgi:hypothetical protein